MMLEVIQELKEAHKPGHLAPLPDLLLFSVVQFGPVVHGKEEIAAATVLDGLVGRGQGRGREEEEIERKGESTSN